MPKTFTDSLPTGISRINPVTHKALTTSEEWLATPNWLWRVRARRATGEFDQLYPQDPKRTLTAMLEFLQRERWQAIERLATEAGREKSGVLEDDIERLVKRRASAADIKTRIHNFQLWKDALGPRTKTLEISTEQIELTLEQWKRTMVSRQGKATRRRWSSSTLRARAMHLSTLFTTLYPKAENPVMAMRDRLPPKSPEVDRAQPLDTVRALLAAMRQAPTHAQRTHPTFVSIRTAVLGLSGLTIQELWSLKESHIDLRRAVIHVPAKRVVERYETINRRGVVRVTTETQQARDVALTIEALDWWRKYLAQPTHYQGGGALRKWGYFAVGSFRQYLREASRAAGLDYALSPYDFGTANAPALDEVRAVVKILTHDTVMYRPTRDTGKTQRAYIRASVLAFTGARVGEIALLEPGDIRLAERVVLMPTEKKAWYAGEGERAITKRRIPLNDEAIAAFKMFIDADLFDRIANKSHVPDESAVPWYQEFYHQVRWAAQRTKDAYTGAPLKFSPHAFRHSFATALANAHNRPDVKTCAGIMGHSPRTFMRYVRTNETAAREAIEGLSVGAQPLPKPALDTQLRAIAGGKS